MKKARFTLNMLRHLKSTAEDFKAQGVTNGNAINKVVKDAENKSYDSDLFATGELSKTTLKNGSAYKLQDAPNWREIFINYLK